MSIQSLIAVLLLFSSISLAQEIKPEQLYRSTVTSVMTLNVEKRDGASSLGAGFITLKDGMAVTAWHVVKDAKRAIAKFSDGEEYEVSGLIDKDEKRDIALIRVKVFGRPLLSMVSADPDVGSKAYVIGSPRGLEFSISDGLVSQIQIVDSVRLYQFSCAASQGNSGGPLLNAKGQVLGVVSWQFKGGQNLNFAIPAKYVLGLDSSLPTQPWETVKSTAANEPTTAQDYYNLGAIMLDKDQHQEATEAFRKAIAADPNFAEAYYELGLCLALYGGPTTFPEAIRMLEKYIQIGKDPTNINIATQLIPTIKK